MKSTTSTMNFFVVVGVLAIFCIKDSSQQHSGEKVNVSLYYDSQCPSCENFIVKQLYPAYQKIGSSLNVEFLPYGNIGIHILPDLKLYFFCRFPLQCDLNKLEACGLAKLSDQDKQMAFVHCVENQERKADDKTRAEKCAPVVGLTADDLLKCSRGPEGYDIFEKLAYQTINSGAREFGIPCILFNKKFDYGVTQQALTNFLGTVCSMFSSPPPGCN